MLDEGLQNFETQERNLRLVRSSGTVAALESRATDHFDFTPSELLAARSLHGYYHLGDIDLRLREVGTDALKPFSTAINRARGTALPVVPDELAGMLHSIHRDGRRISAADSVGRRTLSTAGNADSAGQTSK